MKAILDTVAQYYDDCAQLIDDDAKAMGWSSAFNQQLRFDVINYFVDLNGRELLDVGCGDGALFHYLASNHIDCDYNGIDLSTKMVSRAHARYPGISVRQANFLDHTDRHDVIVASGAFSMVSDTDAMTYLTKAIDHLFSLSHEHFIFNLLSLNAPSKSAKFQRFNPCDVMAYCFKKTPYVSLHHGYLPNDFTVHMIK